MKPRKDSRCRLISSVPEETTAESTPREPNIGQRFFPFDLSSLAAELPSTYPQPSTPMPNTSTLDESRQSSFGLLPEELLRESANALVESTVNFEFKKPFDVAPIAPGLPSNLLQPSTPKANTSAVDLSALYNTTLDASDSDVATFDWKEVYNQTPTNNQPKIAIQAPSGDVSGNDSFYKGSLSGRSTSIGSGSNCSKTLDEKFNDFSKEASFGSNPFQMGDDEFGPVVEDNLALMNAEEKRTEVEKQFVQHDAMANDTFKNAFVDPSESTTLDVTSMSQFFASNSSRVGSLEASVLERPGSGELRPNLGLSKIVSPQKEPIKMLEATLNKTFSVEEKRDLKDLIMKGADTEILKNFIKQKFYKNELKPDESIVPDAVTSFLEMTQNYTFAKDEASPRKIDSSRATSNKSPNMSKIPVRSPNRDKSPNMSRIPVRSPNRDKSPNMSKIPVRPSNRDKSPISFANKENVPLYKKQPKTEQPKKFLGADSKIPISQSKKNLGDHKKQRHSSPVKLLSTNVKNKTSTNEKTVHFMSEASTLSEGPTLASFMSSTGIQSTVESTSPGHSTKQKPFTSSEFPIQATKLKIDWIPTPVNGSSEQIVTLKNTSDKKLTVNLAIIESDEFIFKTKRQQKAMVTFNPEETVSIPVLFLPLSIGEKNSALTIRVQGFKNLQGKSVKSTLPLHGLAETEFHSMPIEETMSETLMDVTNLNHTRGQF